MTVIRVRDEDIQRMIDHSKKERPYEACGILAGKVRNETVEVTRVYECDNVHPNPTVEYFVKPEDQLRIFLEVEEDEDMDLVGFYHSHPEGPDSPSQIDASNNYWPDHLIAIVALSPEPQVTFWKWKDGRYQPLEMLRERF